MLRGRAARRCRLPAMGPEGGSHGAFDPCHRAEKDPYIAPTVGVSRPVQVPVSGYNVTIYDMGGAEGFRGVWKNFYSDVRAAACLAPRRPPSEV